MVGMAINVAVVLGYLGEGERWQIKRLIVVGTFLVITVAFVAGVRKYLKQKRAIARYMRRNEKNSPRRIDPSFNAPVSSASDESNTPGPRPA
jgi:hypothetical protein